MSPTDFVLTLNGLTANFWQMVLVTSATTGFNQVAWNSASLLVSWMAYPAPTAAATTAVVFLANVASTWNLLANGSTATVLTCGAFSISIPSPL